MPAETPPPGDGAGASGAPAGAGLVVDILPQPDDATCGPTCLHAVYRHHGLELPLEQVIDEVPGLETGGTLAVHLGRHALGRGFRAKLLTYNLHVFDPTWFQDPGVDLAERLRSQAAIKEDPKLRLATEAYLDFLARGGEIHYEELDGALLRRYLRRGLPVLTGLCATYLYGSAREIESHDAEYDDLAGVPTGHFVVLAGYEPKGRRVRIADPWLDNPLAPDHHYEIAMDRVLGAIFLGVLTYDANLLVIEPGGRRTRPR